MISPCGTSGQYSCLIPIISFQLVARSPRGGIFFLPYLRPTTIRDRHLARLPFRHRPAIGGGTLNNRTITGRDTGTVLHSVPNRCNRKKRSNSGEQQANIHCGTFGLVRGRPLILSAPVRIVCHGVLLYLIDRSMPSHSSSNKISLRTSFCFGDAKFSRIAHARAVRDLFADTRPRRIALKIFGATSASGPRLYARRILFIRGRGLFIRGRGDGTTSELATTISTAATTEMSTQVASTDKSPRTAAQLFQHSMSYALFRYDRWLGAFAHNFDCGVSNFGRANFSQAAKSIIMSARSSRASSADTKS